MQFEMLEGRRLLTATLVEGVLTVTGTAGADIIGIRPVPNAQLAVYEGLFSTTWGGMGGHHQLPPPTLFPAASVNSIVINGLDGNDAIHVFAVKPAPSPTLAPPVAIPTTAYGGAGNDRIMGNVGNDELNGEAGDDFIDGNRGDDNLSGGDGRDVLRGGLGADNLSGGANNDLLDARDRRGDDVVDGGDNDAPTPTHPGDVALVDVGDDVTNVERVVTYSPPSSSGKFTTGTTSIGGDVLEPGGGATIEEPIATL